MAMPWKLAKAKAAAIRADTTGESLVALNRLFNACFRIQAEASLAARRHIPLVVENVRGAQKWVGRARWNFGSFYLWGDVPALMPITAKRSVMKQGIAHRPDGATNFHGHRKINEAHRSKSPAKGYGQVTEGGIKNSGGSWFNIGSPGQKETNRNPVHELSGVKQAKSGRAWFADKDSISGSTSSKSSARKAASAMIAKIPLTLSRHIARSWKPMGMA